MPFQEERTSGSLGAPAHPFPPARDLVGGTFAEPQLQVRQGGLHYVIYARDCSAGRADLKVKVDATRTTAVSALCMLAGEISDQATHDLPI